MDNKRVSIVMLGAPCSGKSVIGGILSDELGIEYISSGDIARQMDSAKDMISKGEFAPEEEMRKAILKRINKAGEFVLDGFPRFKEQYYWLKDNYDGEIIFVHVESMLSELISRTMDRKRDDDEFKTFINRYNKFVNMVIPMIYDDIISNGERYIVHYSRNRDKHIDISMIGGIYKDVKNSEI